LPSRAKSTWRIPTARTDPPDRGISSCVSSHPTRHSPESDTRRRFAQAQDRAIKIRPKKCGRLLRASQALGGEHARPLVEGQVAGDDNRAALIALAEDLEQQLGTGR